MKRGWGGIVMQTMLKVPGYYLDASHTVGGWGMASLLSLHFLW